MTSQHESGASSRLRAGESTIPDSPTSLPDEYVVFNAEIPLAERGMEHADSLHIRHGVIVWIGRAGNGESSPVDAHGRSNIPVWNVQGRPVFPGFIDNHVHTLITGELSSDPDLSGLDEESIRDVLRVAAKDREPRTPLYGHGWDYSFWPTPHRRVIDDIVNDRPVALFQFSGHAACVNTAMLRELGITRDTADPVGGLIDRDDNGEPTGVLREGASSRIHATRMKLVNRDPERLDRAIARAQKRFAEFGITSVGDNTWYPPSVRSLRRLLDEGRLLCRTSVWSLGSERIDRLKIALSRYSPPSITRGAEKYFLDGAFSTRTANLLDPYEGELENHGTVVLGPPELDSVLRSLSLRRQQGAFHAIGDGAVHSFLNAIERVRKSPVLGKPNRRLRHRLEHCQLVHEEDIQRFRSLGVLAAVQPHAIGSFEKDAELLGAERAARAYPYRAMIDAGVPLSFGSDSPAEASVAPLEGIRKACLRPSDQAISAREAIECYTYGSAYAENSESRKGTLAAGMLADFVVLSCNPCDYDIGGDPRKITDAVVEYTVMGGDITYRHEESD